MPPTALKKLFSLFSILLIFTLGLTACSNATKHNRAEENIVTYLEPNTFTSLYPPSGGFYPNGGIVNQIADRLLYQDPTTLELSPWIATEMPQVNEDATEYTFTIRTDVTYSDGSKLTPENVVKNIDLYAKGDKSRKLTPSEQISNYDHGEVVDENTVKFFFKAPAPGFLQATSSYNAGLLSDATLEKDNTGFAPGEATSIIGSGPFVIAEEKMGTELLIKAREDYDWAPQESEHQGRAYVDGVRYVLASEDSVRVGGLAAGQGDIARQIEAPEEKHLKDRGIIISSHATNGANNQLAFRFRYPLLADIRVRQAVIAGVDRDDILNTLFSESYPKATSVLARTAAGYQDHADDYQYDPEKAKKLLDEAGWVPAEDGIRVKDGKRLVFNINEALPQPRSREVITKVQEHLKRIGIEVTLNPGDRAAQTAALADMNIIQINHSMVGSADYDVIKLFLGADNRDNLLNKDAETGELGDPELQKLLDRVSSTKDEKERAKASAEVQQMMVDKAYSLPLFEEPQVYGLQPYVEGFEEEAIGRPWFYNITINHQAKEARQ